MKLTDAARAAAAGDPYYTPQKVAVMLRQLAKEHDDLSAEVTEWRERAGRNQDAADIVHAIDSALRDDWCKELADTLTDSGSLATTKGKIHE